MDLEQLLGADYKEGITAEEVNAILEKRLLATGKYTNKEAADANQRKATEALKTLQEQLKGKMSEDELSKAEKEDLQKQLEEAQKVASEYKKQLSKSNAESGIAEVKTILGLKADDKDFLEFIENISLEDSEKTKKISSYTMKIVKEAYEKGKAEATKTALGQVGNMVIGQDGKAIDKDEAFVKGIIASKSTNKPKNEISNFI